MATPLVFISYSHEDEAWKDRLVTHLGALEQQGLLEIWDDRRIGAGDVWQDEISANMAAASVTILLVSAHSLRSDFITQYEIPKLLERREREGLRVFPLLVSPCAWERVPWLQRLQIRPVDAQPLSVCSNAADVDLQLAAIAGEVADCVRGCRSARGDAAVAIPPRRVSVSRLPATDGLLVGREAELGILDQAWREPHTNVLSVVAWGGVGKSALLNRWVARLAKDQYRGAELVYGWSFYLQGTEAQLSADDFIAAALEWFGDKDPARGSEWEKGVRLAELVRSSRTLMLLDGLEPLQNPPGRGGGSLRDKSLTAFLRELAANNSGLCVISSRLSPADLSAFPDTVQQINLECLSPEAGAELLRAHGVSGEPAELCQASREYGGHGLALTLLGTYIRDVHGGDITERHGLVQLEQDDERGGHARRVMESYERWLGDDPALAVLSMVAMFDRPARAEELVALRNPAIVGLTDRLHDLDHGGWSRILARLRSAHLLLPVTDRAEDRLDAHPLVREYFGDKLRRGSPRAWQAANARLYEYFRDAAAELPESLGEMDPLFRAVAFGCRAGRYRDALHEVYLPRIMRGDKRYAASVLGAHSAVLSALANFFVEGDWTRPVSAAAPGQAIAAEDQLLLLTHVGPALLVTKGWSSAEVIVVYDKARAICLQTGDSPGMFHVMRGLWSYYAVAGKLPQARQLALELVRVAEADGSVDLRLEAFMTIGHTEFWSGNFEEAVPRLDASFELYDLQTHHDSHTALYGEDPAAIYACYKPVVLGVLGFVDQGERVIHDALELSKSFHHSFSKGLVLYGAAWFYAQHRDGPRTERHAIALGDLAGEHGFVGWAALSQTMRGWAATLMGRIDEGIELMTGGRAAWISIGCGVKRLFFATLLADASLRGGRLHEAEKWIAEAMNAARSEGYYAPEAYRVKAEWLQAAGGSPSEATASAHEALRVARAQRAPLFELRAATALSRVSGQTADLRRTLDQFTEGFDTADLKAAQAILQTA